VGNRRATVHPDISNAQLGGAMDGLLADWSNLMESVGSCPTDDFIYNDRRHLKLPAFLSWMARLQQHHRACLERMEAFTQFIPYCFTLLTRFFWRSSTKKNTAAP
jgi:hypothetical protein